MPRFGMWVTLSACLIISNRPATLASESGPAKSPAHVFSWFKLPEEWQRQFWEGPDAQALLALDDQALIKLVPVQAGLRFCRCPECALNEASDPLAWSITKSDKVRCRNCGAEYPNEKIPAKAGTPPNQSVPEEVVDVRPRVKHRYPYHTIDAEKQYYPEERLYFSAKRDYEARAFLTKAALYAALRYRDQWDGAKDPKLAKLASLLVLRSAQVYPDYSTHYDQADQPKHLGQAELDPPYRRGYGTAKWDWSGCLDVPLGLAVAYSIVRDTSALQEAGKVLGESEPARTIEGELFQSSARFVMRQPVEWTEASLFSIRGILMVGRLLNDPGLMHEGLRRLEEFGRRGFTHDGFWRQGSHDSHQRVMGVIDGWIDPLLAGYSDPDNFVPVDGSKRIESLNGAASMPIFTLARRANGTAIMNVLNPDVQQTSWPVLSENKAARGAMLLGGAGLARLSVGGERDGLDLELSALGDYDKTPSARLSLRLAVAGRQVLTNPLESTGQGWGWERSTASHNAVLVDGLNHRESLEDASRAAPGGDLQFFGADPDFQVARFADRYAYPRSTNRFRHTVITASGEKARYAVSVFEVQGGVQHDQVFHARGGSGERWRLPSPMRPGPESLLPASLPFLPDARADDGRWFVQAYGGFDALEHTKVENSVSAQWQTVERPGLRIHLIGDDPMTVFSGQTPRDASGSARANQGSAALVVRRRSHDGSTLSSTYVSVFEPLGVSAGSMKVNRVKTASNLIALKIEFADEKELLIINLAPGTPCEVMLNNGDMVRTDGLVVRVTGRELMLAGGTFADAGTVGVRQSRFAGQVTRVGLERVGDGRGSFLTNADVSEPETLEGRTLLIRHGDGTARGWTIRSSANIAPGTSRIDVVEEPGFVIDGAQGLARYYQFPLGEAPAPHEFVVCKMARVRR